MGGCRYSCKRREFLQKGSVAGGAALLLGRFPYSLHAGATTKAAQDRISLGRTGIEVSRLAQGTGSFGSGGRSNQTQLGTEGLAELLRAGVDQGLNFWDMGEDYGSHPAVKEALKTVPRDEVVIMTKADVKGPDKLRASLDRFRREMGTDMIDIVLMHCMFAPDWPTRLADSMDVLSEAKEKGIVRAVGVSCHSVGALRASAQCDWVDVQLARLNPVGIEMDDEADVVAPILAGMRQQGKGVIGMKILGAGFLREEVEPALEYAVASPALDAFTIGAENREELEDLLAKIPAASTRG
jgi:aryl-alcohol dehydrogenase-like predicted oxidoreductase